MKSHQSIPSLETILSNHADDLVQNRDTTAQLIQEFEQHWPELTVLLMLAGTLKKSLVRRRAPISLVQYLREDLREGHQPAVQAATRRRRWVWIGAITSIIATATVS